MKVNLCQSQDSSDSAFEAGWVGAPISFPKSGRSIQVDLIDPLSHPYSLAWKDLSAGYFVDTFPLGDGEEVSL